MTGKPTIPGKRIVIVLSTIKVAITMITAEGLKDITFCGFARSRKLPLEAFRTNQSFGKQTDYCFSPISARLNWIFRFPA